MVNHKSYFSEISQERGKYDNGDVDINYLSATKLRRESVFITLMLEICKIMAGFRFMGNSDSNGNIVPHDLDRLVPIVYIENRGFVRFLRKKRILPSNSMGRRVGFVSFLLSMGSRW